MDNSCIYTSMHVHADIEIQQSHSTVLHLCYLSDLSLHYLVITLQAGEEPCPLDPWIVTPEKSKYVDLQTLKLQENPEVLNPNSPSSIE